MEEIYLYVILKVYMRKWKRERDKLQTLEIRFVVFLLYKNKKWLRKTCIC